MTHPIPSGQVPSYRGSEDGPSLDRTSLDRRRPTEPIGESVTGSQGTLVGLIFAAYMAIAVGLYVWRGASFTPDRWVVLLLIGALVMGKALAFLRDWIPVVLLIAGYEMMRKLAGQLVAQHDRTVHVDDLIEADRAIFGGQLPTIWLQSRLYDVGQVHWFDYAALLFYALHFVFPLAFAFLLWLTRKERFWQFTLGFLVMTYAAFAFFLLYPAAPPWFAQRYEYIDGVSWPAGQALQAMVPQRYNNFDTFSIWDDVSGNAVAAMPSLHAAFPWLVLLFAVKFYGRRGLLFLPYSPMLWFSVVYLGHHWVVDIVGGVVWATLCFIVVQVAWPYVARGFSIPMPKPVRTGYRRLAEPFAAAYSAMMAPVGKLRTRLIGAALGPLERRTGRSRG